MFNELDHRAQILAAPGIGFYYEDLAISRHEMIPPEPFIAPGCAVRGVATHQALSVIAGPLSGQSAPSKPPFRRNVKIPTGKIKSVTDYTESTENATTKAVRSPLDLNRRHSGAGGMTENP
ncbi:serine/threonine protein kinase [Thiohalobacter thiocyanaticus]|uniref:Serine/threonine protein kinase n=1 Tax=Thiohalobacter thiocyanaticus TaxID=585455 RepID=A0A1Z4VQV2_9GAMM|nr:hypothetical protein [Thiohalobacter thiocyanaticus]BAZ93863.1 serine/threonine protein kinase [Thiohalobacter thiocyanaticus]